MELDYKRIKEIGNGQCAFTLKDDEKNILATYGLGPCIGILAIDKKLGFTFMAHSNAAMSYYHELKERSLHIQKLINIIEFNKDKQFNLEFIIFKGMDKDPDRLAIILDSIKDIDVENCTISSVGVISSYNGTVFYDPITQTFGEYNKDQNQYRNLTDEIPNWAKYDFSLEDLLDGTVDEAYDGYDSRRKF